MSTKAYFNGEIGNYDEMSIPLSDRSVFYGDAVYDAVLVLNKKPFTLGLHLDRLYRSCELTDIRFTMPREKLVEEIDRLLAVSEGDSLMLYLQVTRGAAPRKHEYPANTEPNLIMFLAPTKLPPKDKRASLLGIEDLRFQYCNIKTTNLMPNVFAAEKATKAGATEAMLHRGARVTEGAHSSILMIKDGTVVMPPLDELVLPGITRKVIHSLCDRHGIPVSLREFSVDELMAADEIILCSTTKNVIYVYEIDGVAVGGKDRALAQRIQALFLDEVYRETGARI
ncbi:MAG: D-amino acid aminotransferase [Ruminococcaceae bacterium]|nr:D-amino acid aminotransferase [Oscillospiraceae bacterium]